MTLDELDALADAAKQLSDHSSKAVDFQCAANPTTIKSLIALCRIQHEALESWGLLFAVDKWKAALAAFDKFGETE